jgi:hypothetical protein
MSLQVCPAMTINSGQHIESACHISDVCIDHRCLTDEDCGVDATTCTGWLLSAMALHYLIPCLDKVLFRNTKCK